MSTSSREDLDAIGIADLPRWNNWCQMTSQGTNMAIHTRNPRRRHEREQHRFKCDGKGSRRSGIHVENVSEMSLTQRASPKAREARSHSVLTAGFVLPRTARSSQRAEADGSRPGFTNEVSGRRCDSHWHGSEQRGSHRFHARKPPAKRTRAETSRT
jgi:hypothetical protein